MCIYIYIYTSIYIYIYEYIYIIFCVGPNVIFCAEGSVVEFLQVKKIINCLMSIPVNKTNKLRNSDVFWTVHHCDNRRIRTK